MVHETAFFVVFLRSTGSYNFYRDLSLIPIMAEYGHGGAQDMNVWVHYAGVEYTFMKEIGPFQKFFLRTRIVGIERKWFFLENTFCSRTVKGEIKVHAVGLEKYVVKERTGKTVPARAFWRPFTTDAQLDEIEERWVSQKRERSEQLLNHASSKL